MRGGKAAGVSKPTALGTQLNASTYGRTIATIFGMARAVLLLIWAANLREGGSAKKAKKKGVTSYVENVDCLIGSNPIQGVLQMWSNNTNRYVLKAKDSGFITASGSATFSDPDFYWVIGVTAQITRSDIVFSDYGNPNSTGIGGYALAGGTGFVVGDQFLINSPGVPALAQVATMFAGAITSLFILQAGSGFVVGTYYTTTILTGSGSGLTAAATTLVSAQAGGAGEVPLWNVWDHGPDYKNAGAVKFFPWVYGWQPGDGPTVHFPSQGNGVGMPFWNSQVKVYYYALEKPTKPKSPLSFNRFTFEPALGDGTEYADAPAPGPSQQVIMPEYAGLGSSNADLGATGLFPDWRIEVKGSGCRWPNGDADYATMIEDSMKSGIVQTGLQLGQIQRGLNCNDLPALVQKFMYCGLEPIPTPIATYWQPNSKRSLLLAMVKWRQGSGSNPTIADTALNLWTPQLLNVWAGFWTASSVGYALPGNEVTFTSALSGFAYDNNTYVFETDPSTDTIEDSDAIDGSVAGTYTLSVTTAGPSLLFVWVEFGSGGDQSTYALPRGWKPAITYENLTQGFGPAQPLIATRRVAAAGTYTFKFTTPGVYNAVLLALSQSQPSQFPAALGDIIEPTTMQNSLDQCTAYGLSGSIAMDVQRPASDWLAEFYECADTAPVWSGFSLKSIARSEQSFYGNGWVFISPTAGGPVAFLTQSDLIGAADASPITVERKAQVDANNVMQVEYVNRTNDYNYGTVSEIESATIAQLGPRKAAAQTLHEITDPAIARKVLAVAVRRKVYLRNKYKFKLMAKWLFLEAMDLVQITFNDPSAGLGTLVCRLTSVKENANDELECEAEDFFYALSAPDPNAVATAVSPNLVSSDGSVDPVNAPIIFEPVPQLYQNQNERQLWLVVSDDDPNYGGCVANISTDGGVSYNQPIPVGSTTPNGTIPGNAVQGVTIGTWPAGTSPDTTNDLFVDLSESLGTLASYSTADEDNFVYPCYVEGGTTDIPYELMTYAQAVLLSTPHHYQLLASGTGNHLNRSVFGAPNPANVGVSHAGGSRFAFLTPAGTGILKLVMDDTWIGKTLYFKFQARNTFGGGLQDLSTCTAYSYTPAGTMGFVNPGGVPPQLFAVN